MAIQRQLRTIEFLNSLLNMIKIVRRYREEVLWENNISKRENTRVLARLTKKVGISCQEVTLDAGGGWYFKDILNVESVLVSM